ncbi:MAG TPA: sugar phosphate isomerase/epimerase [Pyrinomonadaceae bacterium]|nr:sugar phosphate isomerase/epimerase [Pyrinomonadaceae bacterium]
MNRRRFVNRLALAAAGLSLYNPDALAAGGRKLSRIGMQLYTVRRELEKDFEGTLRRVAALGYREVEFAGYFKHKPGEVRSLLKRLKLDAPAAHVSLAELRGDLRPSIDAAHAIGHKYLLLAWMAPEERRTLEQYRRLADLCNEVGAALGREGLRFAYHNHDFEFAPLEGVVPYDLLLERTDPRAVKLEMDLYWTVKGGANPVDYFERHPGRFHLLHVKDMDATPRRFFADVGRGTIDFKSIFAHSKKAGVRHYFVENDEPSGSPFESLRVSYEYLRRLEF